MAEESNDIINFYEIIPKKYLISTRNPYYDDHHISLPALIGVVGGSGSGKTNWLTNFLYIMHDFETFDKIVILCKNRDEPLYNALADALPKIEFHEIRSEKSQGRNVLIGMPSIDEFKTDDNNLVVFDDLVGERDQSLIEQFYLRCRKRNCTAIYLSQSYFRMPIFVRLQLHMLFILKLSSDRDLNRILHEYAIGVDHDTLLQMYQCATKKRFNFLTIHISAPLSQRYRLNFSPVIGLSSNDESET